MEQDPHPNAKPYSTNILKWRENYYKAFLTFLLRFKPIEDPTLKSNLVDGMFVTTKFTCKKDHISKDWSVVMGNNTWKDCGPKPTIREYAKKHYSLVEGRRFDKDFFVFKAKQPTSSEDMSPYDIVEKCFKDTNAEFYQCVIEKKTEDECKKSLSGLNIHQIQNGPIIPQIYNLKQAMEHIDNHMINAPPPPASNKRSRDRFDDSQLDDSQLDQIDIAVNIAFSQFNKALRALWEIGELEKRFAINVRDFVREQCNNAFDAFERNPFERLKSDNTRTLPDLNSAVSLSNKDFVCRRNRIVHFHWDLLKQALDNLIAVRCIDYDVAKDVWNTLDKGKPSLTLILSPIHK